MHNETENRTQYEWLALRCQSGELGAFEDLIAVMERPLLYYAASWRSGRIAKTASTATPWIGGIWSARDPDPKRSS